MFNQNYILGSFHDNILKIDTPSTEGKSQTFKIVLEFLFECMKDVYRDMSYLKMTILVPTRNFYYS